MQRRAWLLAALLAAPQAQAEPLSYRLDPAHSFVHAEVRHFGTSTIRIRFGPIEGRVLLDHEAGRGSVAIEIATASASSGVRVFDRRLSEADLLATAEYPRARYAAEDLRFGPGGELIEVRGELSLRGATQPLVLRALRFGCTRVERRDDAPQEVCGGDFEAETDRSAYGMVFGLPLVADRVRIVVQVEGVRE